LNSKTFLKNVVTLLSGTALAQAIPILISPLLTRIYSPGEIGVYTIFFATSNILAILSSGRLEQAVLIPKHRKDSFNVVKLAFCFSIIVSTISFLALLFFKSQISSLLGLSTISNWIFLIPLTSFFIVIFQVYSFWLNRNDKYLSISKGKVSQGVFMAFIQVSLSILGTVGLVLGRFVGAFFSSAYLFFLSIKLSPKLFLFNKSDLKTTLITYKDYPIYTMPNALLNSISNNLPLYLLESFYDAKATGFYSWSVRIIQGPMGMIIASLQQVFFREASKKYNNGESVFSLTKGVLKKLFLIGIIPYTVIFFYSPSIFAFVFGEEWRIAGEYTKFLVPWFFMVFLTSPISSIILIFNKQKIYFLYEFLLFISRLIALYCGYRFFNDPIYSVIFYGIVGFVFNSTLLIVLIRLSKK